MQKLKKFEVIEGGKDLSMTVTLVHNATDGTPPSGNWLIDLEVGTKFSVRSKTDRSNFMLATFEKVSQTAKSVRLFDAINDKYFGDVEPNRFINFFELVELVQE